MEEILLTISIPTFNRSKELHSQLYDIHLMLSDTRISENIEILVSDNGSTDSTPNVVKDFSSMDKLYKFTSIRSKENLGSDTNFMNSVLNASGRFVWIMSDDDKIHEGAIQYLFKVLSSNLDIGFGFVNFFINKGEPQTSIQKNDNYYTTSGDLTLLLHPLLATSMISSCIFRKDLLSKDDMDKYIGTILPHSYWALNLAIKSSSLIIEKPLFSHIDPGVHEKRAASKNREDFPFDFYLYAHITFLNFCSSLVDYFDAPFNLRYKLYRITLNESINQIIFHKITSEKYDVAAIKSVFSTMIKKYYFSPTFWLVCLPILILPSSVAKFIEPLRWKYLEVRGYFGDILRKII